MIVVVMVQSAGQCVSMRLVMAGIRERLGESSADGSGDVAQWLMGFPAVWMMTVLLPSSRT
jgi:hypothetical protein